MEICVDESCVTVTDHHAIAYKNDLNEHDFKIAQNEGKGNAAGGVGFFSLW